MPYLLILLGYVDNNHHSCNSGCKGKDDNNEVNDIVPGGPAEENFWCEGKDTKENLKENNFTSV